MLESLFGAQMPLAASEVKAVKDFIGSQHMQDAFKRVNAMSTAPLEFIWLEELAP